MSEFDADNVKAHLRGESGLAQYYSLSLPAEERKREVALAAASMMRAAVRCVLVELDFDARMLLEKAKEWLEFAIQRQEKNPGYCVNGTDAWRHEMLAMCNWLATDVDDQANLKEAVGFNELYYNSNQLTKSAVTAILPTYVDARRNAQAIEIYEETWEGKRPTSVERTTSESTLAYIIATAKRRGEFTSAQAAAAGRSFLRAQAAKLLTNGGEVRLARWLKILHWNDNPQRQSAYETVRRCHEYLAPKRRRRSAAAPS